MIYYVNTIKNKGGENMGKRMKKSQMAIWLPDEIIAWLRNNDVVISHFVEEAIRKHIERSKHEKYYHFSVENVEVEKEIES